MNEDERYRYTFEDIAKILGTSKPNIQKKAVANSRKNLLVGHSIKKGRSYYFDDVALEIFRTNYDYRVNEEQDLQPSIGIGSVEIDKNNSKNNELLELVEEYKRSAEFLKKKYCDIKQECQLQTKVINSLKGEAEERERYIRSIKETEQVKTQKIKVLNEELDGKEAIIQKKEKEINRLNELMRINKVEFGKVNRLYEDAAEQIKLRDDNVRKAYLFAKKMESENDRTKKQFEGEKKENEKIKKEKEELENRIFRLEAVEEYARKLEREIKLLSKIFAISEYEHDVETGIFTVKHKKPTWRNICFRIVKKICQIRPEKQEEIPTFEAVPIEIVEENAYDCLDVD